VFGLSVSGSVNKMVRAKNRAKTPPSLFGTDRKIAYNHKKYHSGLMCVGVIKGLDRRKFSGSVSRFGLYIIRVISGIDIIMNIKKSLIEKYG
jgi:hypothetical protein